MVGEIEDYPLSQNASGDCHSTLEVLTFFLVEVTKDLSSREILVHSDGSSDITPFVLERTELEYKHLLKIRKEKN